MCPYGTQTNNSCAMHCKPKDILKKSMSQNVNELFKMMSFDTTSTIQLFLEEHNSKITKISVAIATSKPVQNPSLLVSLQQQKPPRN